MCPLITVTFCDMTMIFDNYVYRMYVPTCIHSFSSFAKDYQHFGWIWANSHVLRAVCSRFGLALT